MERFTDLGAGWFLYNEESFRLTVVCDSTSSWPDRHFGPAAWEGRDGPVSGQALLEARPVAGGGWQQSGPDEWKWFSDAGEEFDEAPAGWPRRITVCDGPGMELVAAFAEREVATEDELIALLRSVTSGQQHRILPCVSASSRLATAQFVYPDFFGELDCPSKGTH